MNVEHITQILSQLERGDADEASQQELLSLVYDELRKLAAAKLRHERPDHTLQATALVHEAWVRMVGNNGEEKNWNSRSHFFGAAAQAMRRILIDHARSSQSQKRGGDLGKVVLETWNHPASEEPAKLIELDEALQKLERMDPVKAELVKLRFFAGLTVKEAAAAINVSTATAERLWAYSRAWLYTEMQ